MSAVFAIPRQRPLDEYPPLRVVTCEGDLMRRLTPVPCVCGTDVAHAADETVPLVVARHNATASHVAWRAQQES